MTTETLDADIEAALIKAWDTNENSLIVYAKNLGFGREEFEKLSAKFLDDALREV